MIWLHHNVKRSNNTSFFVHKIYQDHICWDKERGLRIWGLRASKRLEKERVLLYCSCLSYKMRVTTYSQLDSFNLYWMPSHIQKIFITTTYIGQHIGWSYYPTSYRQLLTNLHKNNNKFILPNMIRYILNN